MHTLICNAELEGRLARPPDHEAENQALLFLTQSLAESSPDILLKIASKLLVLCRAQSAGITMAEGQNGQSSLRCRAAAGLLANVIDKTASRESSPSGIVLDRGETLLMSAPGRHFP